MKRKRTSWLLNILGAALILAIAGGFCGILLYEQPEQHQTDEVDMQMTAVMNP